MTALLTPAQTFEHIILHQSAKELVPFLLTLDKPAAIALRKPIQALKKALEEYRQVARKDGKMEYGRRITPEQTVMLALAGFATFSKKEAMGRSLEIPWSLRNPRDNRQHYDLFWQVLRHARPDWLTDLLGRNTRTNIWQALDYAEMRMLESEGLISYDAPTFALTAASLLSDYRWLRTTNSKQQLKGLDQKILADLRADDTLLQRDLPLVFDFDTSVDSAGTYEGEYQKGFTVDWLLLLPQLVASGHLDRADLLTRSLLALRRDFRRPLLTWFKNLFLSLKPTVAERLARQAELVELLAHPLPLVLNFALDQLQDLWTEPAFDPAPLLQYADGLMTRQDLKTALRALLGQFEKLLRRQPALASTLAPLAAAALAHADNGVQERAARLLAAVLAAKKPLLSANETADLTATIAAYADLLTAGARPLLAPWLAAETSPEQPASDNAQPATYAPLVAFVPDISAATAIAPVADWHELLFLTGAALQPQAPDPAAMERWVDGLLRLRGQYPAGYQQQLQPYMKQHLEWLFKDKTAAETAAQLRDFDAKNNRAYAHSLLLALLIGWYTQFEHPQVARIDLRPSEHYVPDPLLLAQQQRLLAAEEQLRTGAAHLPLLSTPTHAPQWVAPSVLVDKLLAWQAAGQAPAAADLAVALARCAWSAEADAVAARAWLPQLHNQELRALLTWLLAPADPAEAEAAAHAAAGAAAAGQAAVAHAQPEAPTVTHSQDYQKHPVTETLTPAAPAPAPPPGPVPPHAAALPALAPPAESRAKSLLERARAKLSQLIPLKAEAPALAALPLAEALPWLWAVAARTRYPVAELPALAALGNYPGLARPWQPGWTTAVQSRTAVQHWKADKPTETTSWTWLTVPTGPPRQLPSPLLLYSAHVQLPQERHNSLWTLAGSLPYTLALLPHHPEPLHWHVLREACRTDEPSSEARDALQVVLRTLLEPGPRHAAGTSALLAMGLVHGAPVCRALALEVLLSAIATARLVPAYLGRDLGRLLALERAPAQRLADQLAQARAISPATDAALAQLLEALLPELPATPPRNTRKLLEAYADLLGRTRTPAPPAVQAHLRAWSSSASLKKTISALAGA